MTLKRLERYALIERVKCPRCGALQGERCKAPSGGPTELPHGARREKAIRAGKYQPA